MEGQRVTRIVKIVIEWTDRVMRGVGNLIRPAKTFPGGHAAPCFSIGALLLGRYCMDDGPGTAVLLLGDPPPPYI